MHKYCSAHLSRLLTLTQIDRSLSDILVLFDYIKMQLKLQSVLVILFAALAVDAAAVSVCGFSCCRFELTLRVFIEKLA